MAFAARRLPDDPILIVTFNVPLEQHLKSLQSLHAEIDGYVRMLSGQACCLIVDMRTLDLTCSDFTLWIEEYRSGTHFFLDQPSVHVLAVGNQPVMYIGLKKIERQLQVSVASFDTIAAALDAAQRMISAPSRA
jgi:hypothetical protein